MISMNKPTIILLVLASAVGLLFVFSSPDSMQANQTVDIVRNSSNTPVIIREEVKPGLASATFAAGCFWCTEAVFQETEGVFNAISGYAGGQEYNPTYEAVYTESTTHREALRVYYDPSIVSYEKLLDIFWQSIDPTDDGGQFVDRGQSYTTAVFYENESQRLAAEASKTVLSSSDRFDSPIVTPIIAFTTFYEAEAYHQDFYKKSADRYKNYADNSGRDEFRAQVWKEIQNQ